MADTQEERRDARLARYRWLPSVGMLLLVALALAVVHRELHGVHYGHLRESLHMVSGAAMLQALFVTAVSHLLLSGYDLLALRYVGSGISTARAVLASLLAYTLSQTLGFALITGGAVRARFWSMWGLSAQQIAKAAAFVGATFMLGVFTVCGLALLLEPDATLVVIDVPPVVARTVGVLLLGGAAGYLLWARLRSDQPIVWRSWTIPVPDVRMALLQLLLGVVDWSVAGFVLYLLLPAGNGIDLLPFLGLFVLAQFVAVASHVPGGIGVFESIMLVALRGTAPPVEILAALVVYRVIYYLIPFSAGLLSLAGIELHLNRAKLPQALGTVASTASGIVGSAARVGTVLQPVLPTVIGVGVFVGGAVLLFSGATPAAHGRVRALTSVLPLGLVEISHFSASVAGVGLLVLGAALRRRLDAAWGATVALLAFGIVASLLKGLDWEEGLLLAVVLGAVVLSRGAFYRPAALTADFLTPGWLIAVLGVAGASIWLGLFAYHEVEFTNELWWQFTVRGNAPRFLRASAGVVAAVMTVGLWRLFRPAAYRAKPPGADDLLRARAIVRRVPECTPSLVLLGDKALVFSDDGEAFVMYGVSGRSWIAMGDPVGEGARLSDAAWRFRELADSRGAWPVFYQVTPARLPIYIDLGLSLLKLGEEAIVPLDRFSLDGSERKWMRRALKDAERAGLEFEIVGADAVTALIPELRRVSDDWLGEKSTREKGFSLGRFDERYLAEFPVAVVRERTPDGPRIVAFANIWRGCEGGELSPDLMRHFRNAPRGTMDFLFVSLLEWGKAHGYRAFNLGMSPLAGLVDSELGRPELAPLWARAGGFVYDRGESFYNFQGLRAFKDKFAPVWEPRYLASPGGIMLPRILANVATLIAGGGTGLVRK